MVLLINGLYLQGEECLQPEDIIKTIDEEGDSIAVLMLSGVQYYTGQLFDMEGITAAAHKKVRQLSHV